MDSLITHPIVPKLLSDDRSNHYKATENGARSDRDEGNKENIPVDKQLSQLSSREIEVLQLIAQGGSNQEIGKQLFIAEKTVKNHITRIFKKLEIKNRTQAAIIARSNSQINANNQPF